MGRSDDSIIRRRNKKVKMKQDGRIDSAPKVSSRVAAIIASKKRRLTGKRRICQGMCFSLPTPEDPFNDRKGKPEPTKKRKRKSIGHKKPEVQKNSKMKVMRSEFVEKKMSMPFPFEDFMGPEVVINLGKPTRQIFKLDGSCRSWNLSNNDFESGIECPPKSLCMFLDLAQNAMYSDGRLKNGGDKSLVSDRWGLDFWNCYSSGKDVLEIEMGDSANEQIAWIASAAAHAISLKKKEGISFSIPCLLFLVPSQDKASKVRSVCKPLKALGIRSVSLHSGATIDHQINGLKNCEPEIIISTPERLLELLSLKAVDLSGVSLLAIEGLEAPFSGRYVDSVKSIRQCILKSARVVVFCDCKNI